MKKLLAMFLAALCMVLCLVPMTALAETETTVPAGTCCAGRTCWKFGNRDACGDH